MGNVEKSILEIILPEGMFEWFDIVKGSKMKILRKPERRKRYYLKPIKNFDKKFISPNLLLYEFNLSLHINYAIIPISLTCYCVYSKLYYKP